jgi:tRNA(fMet)-specific endonuclease VapC
MEPAVPRLLRGSDRLEAAPPATTATAAPRLLVSFLLDTNTCIDFLRGRHPAIRERIRARTPGSIGISVVTAAELRHGAERSTRPEQSHAVLDGFLGDLDVLPLEEPVARAYGRLRTALERAGRTIGANDLFIAAHALALGRTLVTSNVREFRRVAGLRWTDWRT